MPSGGPASAMQVQFSMGDTLMSNFPAYEMLHVVHARVEDRVWQRWRFPRKATALVEYTLQWWNVTAHSMYACRLAQRCQSAPQAEQEFASTKQYVGIIYNIIFCVYIYIYILQLYIYI